MFLSTPRLLFKHWIHLCTSLKYFLVKKIIDIIKNSYLKNFDRQSYTIVRGYYEDNSEQNLILFFSALLNALTYTNFKNILNEPFFCKTLFRDKYYHENWNGNKVTSHLISKELDQYFLCIYFLRTRSWIFNNQVKW